MLNKINRKKLPLPILVDSYLKEKLSIHLNKNKTYAVFDFGVRIQLML